MKNIENISKLSKYINDAVYVIHEMIPKKVSNGSYEDIDFNSLKIEDILFNIPANTPLTLRYYPCDDDNEIMAEFVQNEYSMFKGDAQIISGLEFKIATILKSAKELLTGDSIKIESEKMHENVYRDNFSQNGKVRTVATMMYKIKFS